MNGIPLLHDRRRFMGGLALGAAALWTPGVFAQALMRTPVQTEGPFYPDRLPLDIDNDLLVINDRITPAIGEITHLTGRVLDVRGQPIRNALVEIWQCDGNGVYLHTRDSGGKQDRQDKNFQGFGRFLTGSNGEYYFRTIKPVPYARRPPHIHFKVKKGTQELLVTQCYVKGHAGNTRDGIFASEDARSRDALSVAFDPIKTSKIGELSARFDMVVG